MSYRKPAPLYIPTPPPSPVPPAFEAVPLTEEKDPKEIPPLPDNWREILSSKVSGRNDSTQTFEPGSNEDELEQVDIPAQAPTVPEKPPQYSTPIVNDELVRSQPSPQGHQSPNLRSPRARGLPREYRPPTPPLPSQSVRQLDTDIEDAPPNSRTPPPRKLYHTGSSLNIPSNFHHHPIARGSSLRTTTSFRTEETMGSWNALSTRQTSPGMRTLTDVTMYSYPTSWKNAVNASNIKTDNTLELEDEVSCWEAAGGLGTWAKKVLESLVVCK